MNALVLILVTLCSIVIDVRSASVYTGTPASFSGQYTKYNPLLQGGGVVSGSINYQPDKGVFQLKNTLSAQTFTDTYQFIPPFPTGGFYTKCSASLTSTHGPSVAWSTPLNIPASDYGTGTPPAVTAAPSACEATPGSATCTAGTRIFVSSATGSTITYKVDRFDDTYPSNNCGCAVATFCVPVPSCVDCSSVTVTGGTKNCASTAALCGSVPNAVAITLSTASSPTFSVTMPGTTIGYGPVGITGPAGKTTPVNCPSAVHTCANPGSGVSRYRQTPCSGSQTCEVSDTQDMLYWPLWYNTDYYNPGVSDATMKLNGAACNLFTAKGTFTGSNLVTQLYLTSAYQVCGWNTENGDQYTMTTNVAANAITYSFNCTVNQCQKPLDIVFIVELSQVTSFNDRNNILNFIKTFTNYNTIGSQLTNIAVVTYSSAKVQTALAQGVNLQQLGALDASGGGLSCCNTATGDLTLPCCTGAASNLLPTAIRTAADLLNGFAFRTYTSKNIVLLTHGQFTNTAAEINSALQYASTTTVNRSSIQDPPASAIVNFDALYFGSTKSVLDTLNQVKASNDARNRPLYSQKQLSVAGLESGFDTVVNRVWNRPNTNYIDYNMREIVGGLCASNGGRSCGACCGDCGCGTICAPPNTCKPSTCFNVSLVPPPPSTSTCCNYKLYQCPGATTNPCNVIQCDLILGVCTNQTKSCPSSTACYDYKCNPSSGACDPVAKFSDPNKCFQAYCTISNTVAYKPKVTCQSIPCHTVQCENATGNCINASIPAPNPPSPCHVKSCLNNAWVWNWPSTCTSADKCLTQYCDVPTKTCYMASKCNAPDSCNNVTCDPNVGTCNRVGCPANPTVNGTLDRCQTTPSCTVVSNASLYSTCKYSTTTCTVTDAKCQTSVCVSATGSCNLTKICPDFENGNKCRPLVFGGCATNGGVVTCNYTDKNCSRAGLCVNNTCNPATGNCDFPVLCSQYEGGNNYCRVLNASSCPGGVKQCYYNDVKCNSTDPCKNTTCVPTQINSCPLPDLCPLFRNGDRCWTRVNSSCANTLTGGNCTYVYRNCTPTDPCLKSICQTNTGTCPTATDVCPPFLNGRCLVRDNSTCGLAPNCVYFNATNCTAPNAYSVSTCTTISNTATCSLASCPIYETLTNKCRIIASRLANGTCVYQNVTCNGTAPDACTYLRCDPATGTCGPVNYCPNSTTNKCNFTVTCNGACVYQQVSCQASTDPCFTNVCNATSGTCYASNTCPIFQTTGSTVNRCRNRTSCSPCNYTTFTCPQPADPCTVSSCVSSSGQCTTATKPGCDLYRNGDKCFVRNNASCTSATCTYDSVLVSCPQSTKPCYYPTCSAGVCSLTLNTSFTTRSCPPSPDPCQVAQLDINSPTCCKLVSNCTAPDKCQTASCSGGACTITPICQSVNPVNACSVYTGCSTNGTCLYGPKDCGKPPVACQAAQCDAITGACSFVDTDACIDPCIGIICSPVNCTRQACFNGTCKPISDPPLCPTLSDNYCAVGSCSPINNFCTYTAIQPADCEARYGPANPCFYWGTSPTFPGCCQQLPLCNQQIDPNFKCMLLNCNNDTNGACVLVDNSNAVCPPYQNADRCKPLIRCDNATGGCIYDDVNVYCNNQQQQIDPCFDGVCNSTTGTCYTVNTTRCVPLSKCVNVFCQVDKCAKYVCNETDGNCVLNETTVCLPLDNCTNRVCDPNQGCVPVAFNLSTCNITDPCLTVFANTSKVGCCDTKPTCAPSSDPICNQVTCVNGTCNTKVGKDLCDPFKFDNTTNTSNKCQLYSDCKFGCLYSSVNCPASNASCLVPYCDPATGTCNFTDTCRNDKCVQQVCNTVTGRCDTISTATCKNDFCYNETCIPALGCVKQSSVDLVSCPTTNCTTSVLNPLKPGCCDTLPKCVPSSPCTNATCLANGTCVFSPVCPAKKCQEVSCAPDVNGAPQCFYANKSCSTSSICEYVPPCVEDGKPFVCQAQSVCPQSTDRCVSILCNASATNESEKCYKVPTIDCNDNNDCTVDTCLDGNCTHVECPFTDLCFPAKCNSSNFSCYVTPVVCNDNNACTSDTCVNGTCVFTNITCNDTDACTIDSCDRNLGCVFQTRECLLNESCAYDDTNDKTVQANYRNGVKKNPCAPGKTKKDLENSCDSYVCANQTCIYTHSTCNNYISTAEIIGGSLGAAAIIGIVIACVICAGASGAGVTAYVRASDKELSGSVMNNPLFKGQGTSNNNPLHRS